MSVIGKNYVKELEAIVEQMLRPIKGIPFPLVIKAISSCDCRRYNPDLSQDLQLVRDLERAAVLAGRELKKKGIIQRRTNEVGNYIEAFVKKALNKLELKADVPTTANGKKKATGYPDLYFLDKAGRSNYLECKTYNKSNISTTQRSFYLSPSNNFKVTREAGHFLLSYEIATHPTRRGVFIPVRYMIIALDSLLVDVKYEFNSDNKRLYASPLVLKEGAI